MRQTSETSPISVYRVDLVSTDNILVGIWSDVYYKKEILRTEYLFLLFVGCQYTHRIRKVQYNCKRNPWPESASELYRPSDRRLSAKLVPTFYGQRVPRGQRDGSLRLYSRFSIPKPLRFSFKAALQLYSRGWVDPVPEPLLLRKSGSAENRTRTPGSVPRNSDHWTTEVVYFLLHNIYKFSSYLTGNTIHPRSVARNSDH
jgi:hypothetical protein